MYKCIDCGKKLNRMASYHGTKRCQKCAYKGRNNPSYIDGRTIEIHYCIDCGKKLGNKNYDKHVERCCECYHKFNSEKNHGMYIDGRTLKKYYCSDCNKEISYNSGFYGKGRCTSCENKTRINELSGNWQGGKSFEEYGQDFDSSLKEQVRFRDKYRCQECGCTQLENGKQLDVHHIDYDKKYNVLNNLVALCKSCHIKTNFNRDYWKDIYATKVMILNKKDN